MMSEAVSAADDASEEGRDADRAVGQREPAGSSEDDEGSDHEGDDDEDDGESRDEEWEDLFNRLVQFKSTEGHCLVPFRYKHDRKLGKWVVSQRKLHEKVIASGQKTPAELEERFRRLDEVGFEWKAKDPRHVPWSQRYGELVEFVSRYGHAQVPIGWKENPKLSNWVSAQRQEYRSLLKGRPSRLTEDRIRQLNEVNFIYEARRGGPRRPARATDLVPTEPTPAKGSEQRRATLFKPVDSTEPGGTSRSDVVPPGTKGTAERVFSTAETTRLSPFERTTLGSFGAVPHAMHLLRPDLQGNQLLSQYIALQSRSNPMSFGIGSALNTLANPSVSSSLDASLGLRSNAEFEAMSQLNTLQRISNAETSLRQYAGLQGVMRDSTIPNQVRESMLQRLVPAPSISEETLTGPALQAPLASLLQDARVVSIMPLATPPFLEEAGYEYALIPRSLLQDLRAQQERIRRLQDDAYRTRDDAPYSYPGQDRSGQRG